MHASLRAQLDLTSSPVPAHSTYNRSIGLAGNEMPTSSNDVNLSAEEQQPYHRVVSAPPGRIGVTFVEFRGHAMVSDVAMDSPLSGWVFPSDVLIAVDEIPVSGMRVRDIVKILSNRKDRQRAMRVISSHAMNELTMSQGLLNEEDEEEE
jgi:C-terminal processing protease CtpA/Prc